MLSLAFPASRKRLHADGLEKEEFFTLDSPEPVCVYSDKRNLLHVFAFYSGDPNMSQEGGDQVDIAQMIREAMEHIDEDTSVCSNSV